MPWMEVRTISFLKDWIPSVGEKMKAFRDQLKKKKSPKNLKELLQLITPSKGVRRRDGNQQSILPIDEGFELFDCDGEHIQNDEVDVELESDDESDNKEDNENKKQKQTATKTPQAHVILADLCEENSDPKGDAMFLDSLGKLLSAPLISIIYLLFLIRSNEIDDVTRRAIKGRIQQEKEKSNSNNDTV